VGFTGVRFSYPGGKCDIFTSSDAPLGVAFAFRDDNVSLKLVNKEFPFIDDRSGSIWTPVETRTSGGGTLATTVDLDRYQMKAKGYCTFSVEDPSQNGVIVLPTLSSY
jgi:hypothetical protein